DLGPVRFKHQSGPVRVSKFTPIPLTWKSSLQSGALKIPPGKVFHLPGGIQDSHKGGTRQSGAGRNLLRKAGASFGIRRLVAGIPFWYREGKCDPRSFSRQGYFPPCRSAIFFWSHHFKP